MVCRSTTRISLAVAQCPAGTIYKDFTAGCVVVGVTPPGNKIGPFRLNVGRRV
ncbi:hypothetical protein OG288_00385 [Streptomyces tauricus]|uniref:Uncharacterized protein n=1 Tax=Streptomyces tauricus TaxID=68274 RepID=A0ABZ1J5M7_9ACTN|nr:hypothetical protein [Streptomyces tauricus]